MSGSGRGGSSQSAGATSSTQGGATNTGGGTSSATGGTVTQPGNGATGGAGDASLTAGAGAGGGSAAPAGGRAGSAGSTSGTAGSAGATSGTAGSAASALYHQLSGWLEPAPNNRNHHGQAYFLGNAHKDENGLECTSCHGNNYQGDTGPACANCHSEWRSDCSFCHGLSPTGSNPPLGVWDEVATNTLAVGRHEAHLRSGNSHQAFACSTCHTVPPNDDVDHTLAYKPSDDLSTPGHHGDVVFASGVNGMSFAVDATSGTPQTARGTCVGACHSDGRGGKPVQTAYWAGGTWTSGCGSCHAAEPRTGTHNHALDEGATCADCHSGSTTSTYSAVTHFNGTADFLGTVQGQGMTLRADDRCASGVSCNGNCHGDDEEHNNQCW